MRLRDEADDLELLGAGEPHASSPPSAIMLFLSSRNSSACSATTSFSSWAWRAEVLDLVAGRSAGGGFRRNLLGLKSAALLLNAVVVAICVLALWLRVQLGLGDDVSLHLAYVLIVALLHAAFFLLAVHKNAVREAANQYARQLLLACETLATGAPLKKATRAKAA